MLLASSIHTSNLELAAALRAGVTERGSSLLDMVEAGPILLVFLRHFGCSYCRQSIADVAALSGELAARRVTPVFVHLGSPERAKPYFEYYGLADVERISDPDALLYNREPFALSRQHPLSHFLWPVNWKAWLSHSLRKYGIGMIREDSYQMPGIFFLRGGEITSFRFRRISDQPDYLALVS